MDKMLITVSCVSTMAWWNKSRRPYPTQEWLYPIAPASVGV